MTITADQIRRATDSADAEVPLFSARAATRREIARELRSACETRNASKAELSRALNIAELRAWRRR